MERVEVQGAGVRPVADAAGPADATPVVFLHGGGQTRASWGKALTVLAAEGYRALSFDLRGHGESDWDAEGDYRLDAIAADIAAIVAAVGRPPVLVGASLGGMASLWAAGCDGVPAAGLILVDVAPRIEAGASKIQAFMTGNPNGFASLDEVADAVAAYLPHRPRPKDTGGLMKNLRLKDDGRLYWHWDPRLMSGERRIGPDHIGRLEDASRALTVPTLLIRGGRSDVVSPEGAKAFLELCPHAEFVDVAGADHMVAGDANDAFNAAVIDFIRASGLIA